MTIRVVIADDHAVLRDGLRRLLTTERDIEVVGEAGDGQEVQRVVAEQKPDVVLMDIQMPIADGAAATREIVRNHPDVGVIILTMHNDDAHVFPALQAGARGYVLKSSRAHELVAAIRAVHGGASLIEPSVAARLLGEYRRLASETSGRESAGGLTETERELLRHVAGGFSNKEIAARLGYAESTVKNRLSVLFEKIQVSDRTQAAVYAVTNGLLPPSRDSERG